MILSDKWKETTGPCLRNFDEQGDINSVNGALALRPQIEKIVDEIWEKGFDGIYCIGIGGTYASAMQAEVYMRGKSSLPVYFPELTSIAVKASVLSIVINPPHLSHIFLFSTSSISFFIIGLSSKISFSTFTTLISESNSFKVLII